MITLLKCKILQPVFDADFRLNSASVQEDTTLTDYKANVVLLDLDCSIIGVNVPSLLQKFCLEDSRCVAKAIWLFFEYNLYAYK